MVSAVRCYSSISIDWHVPHDGDVVVFFVHHSLWLVLVPFVCNLDIMIFTDDNNNNNNICFASLVFLKGENSTEQRGQTVRALALRLAFLKNAIIVPLKFYISTVFNSSCDLQSPQEKLKMIAMQNFEGARKSTMVFLNKAYWEALQIRLEQSLKLNAN